MYFDSQLYLERSHVSFDDINLLWINALGVRSHLHPEVTDPQQLVDDTYEFLMQNIAYLSRTQSTGGN